MKAPLATADVESAFLTELDRERSGNCCGRDCRSAHPIPIHSGDKEKIDILLVLFVEQYTTSGKVCIGCCTFHF